ncbi:MAG TPA: hypothetical protein PLF13_05390 [candidate division Zixibacteria bacterium]|nr:hypothetical protein [candidate division Zixibacteria bacterium]
MLKDIFKTIGTGVRWIVLVVVVLFLVEELIRVFWYVVGEWGFLHALIDGAVLYKIGEAAILIPFFLFVHWVGVWDSERSLVFARKTRWLIRAGGLLSLVAYFDLFHRVIWAWWVILLIALALILPPLMKVIARKRAVWWGRILAAVIVIVMLIHYVLSFLLTGYFIAPLPGPTPSPADTPEGRWQQDLVYLADNLPRLHLNAFHTVTKERFNMEVERFREAIPDLNPHQLKAGFYRIVALIGDGHTGISNWEGPLAGKLPVRFYWLSDGLFITAAAQDQPDLLGGKVLRLDGLSADSVFDSVCTLLPYETDSYLLHQGVRYLIDVDFLQGLGLADDSGRVDITVVSRTGDTIHTYLEPVTGAGQKLLTQLPETPPAFKSSEKGEYWSEFFDDGKIAYLKYNAFTSPLEFPKFTKTFWAEADSLGSDYLIIDFRENGGGMSYCFDDFYDQILAHERINRKGHLYLLTNRRTFSSASMYAAILRRETEVILAGEDMGGGLNQYGDMRFFTLPNSGVQVSYSVQYFELWPDSLGPFVLDLPIPVSSSQYFSSQDPVLDSVLTVIRGEEAAETVESTD